MPGLCYEDFEVGRIYRHDGSRSVTMFDNIWHTCMTLNPQPLHLSRDFAEKKTPARRNLFNSFYTLSIVIGQTVTDLTRGTLIETVGMADIQYPRPVFDGDTLYSRTTVLGKEEPAEGPGGIVELLHEGFNQDEQLVATCKRRVRVRTRAEAIREPD